MRKLIRMLLCSCALLLPAAALAQAYPSKPVRLIVPFPAGGKVSGVPMPSSSEEYSVFLVQEQRKWGAVVKAIGFKAE